MYLGSSGSIASVVTPFLSYNSINNDIETSPLSGSGQEQGQGLEHRSGQGLGPGPGPGQGLGQEKGQEHWSGAGRMIAPTPGPGSELSGEELVPGSGQDDVTDFDITKSALEREDC